MELKGESFIAAPREAVWQALNDPAVLARCIDGVETLTRVGADRFEGKMNAKVGPVRASFTGGVNLTELDPPNRYVIVGEGKGGVAGFAKGSAEVVLTAVNTGDIATTRLNYHVTSSVGGKLAQLGARLIEGTAKAYAETFFERFKIEVEGPPPVLESGDAAAGEGLAIGGDAVQTGGAVRGPGLPPLVWGGLVVVLVLVLLFWLLQ
ncbi:MAG: CoxG family protein [Polymorphobacter sp.]